MTKELKITFNDIIKVLEDHYNIENIKFMKSEGHEPDREICDFPDYVIGKVVK